MSATRRDRVSSGPVNYLITDGSKVLLTIPFNPSTAALWMVQMRMIGIVGALSSPTMGAIEVWCPVRYDGTTKGIPSTSPANGNTTLRHIFNGSGGLGLVMSYASNTLSFAGSAASSATLWLHVELLEWEI